MLGITHEKIILLDHKTKALAKSERVGDLQEWYTGEDRAHGGLVLEFRGTKSWILTTPSLENLKYVAAALWEAMDIDGRFLPSSGLRRNSIDFGKSLQLLFINAILDVNRF